MLESQKLVWDQAHEVVPKSPVLLGVINAQIVQEAAHQDILI